MTDERKKIDFWAAVAYVLVFVALVYVLNDITGLIQTPAERRIERRVTKTVVEEGMKGAKGDSGKRGPQGAKGDSGKRGPQGAKGDQGSRGIAGSRGAEGPRGIAGSRGPQGQSGAQGPQGSPGPTGDPGATVEQVLAAVCARTPIC